MERYDTRIDDGILYIEADSEDIEIGAMESICSLLGGETYTIQYDEDARKMGWLRTDEDGTLTFDVRETLADMDFDERFVGKMAAEPIDRTNPDGHPVRTAAFTDLMAEIWDSKGNVELDS